MFLTSLFRINLELFGNIGELLEKDKPVPFMYNLQYWISLSLSLMCTWELTQHCVYMLSDMTSMTFLMSWTLLMVEIGVSWGILNV